MRTSRLFGDRPIAAVSIVEPSLSRWYAHRARVAFFTMAAVVSPLVMAVLSLFLATSVAIVVGLLVGVVCGFAVAVVVRAWPVLRVLWWWSAEITLTVAVVTGLMWLSRKTSPVLALGVLATVLATVWLVRPVRRRVAAWVWCAVVRHRLRLCFAEFIRAASRTRPGVLPLILLARPTPAGERVWVWLRPGLDLSDLEGKTGRMAVACLAGEVRVVRASAAYAALIRVDVSRRDPLTGRVFWPLAQRVGSWNEALVPVSPGMPPVGLDLDEVPEPPAEQPRRGRS